MSTALYRKYRPKSFSDVSGQEHIKLTLQNEIKTDKVAHAYLFCGPRGTGKTTLARLLSKAVNCLDLQENGEPCNKCKSCTDILDSRSLDIIEIDAASHTGVENVRENIIQNARFTPVNTKFKVFIIDEVHMLSISAFNALLKILEEPPAYVIFILATTEAHKLPSTIISRCQRFDFKRVNFNSLVDRLRWITIQENLTVDEKVLAIIAKQSGGCVRDAESLLEQIISLGDKNITLEQAELILPRHDFENLYLFLDFILKKDSAEALDFINNLVKDGIDIALFTNSFVEFVRKILVYQINEDLNEFAREIDDSVVQKILSRSSELKVDKLTDIIKKCWLTKELFKQSYIAQLPLEIAVLELIGTSQQSQTVQTPVSKNLVKQVPIVEKPVIKESPKLEVENKQSEVLEETKAEPLLVKEKTIKTVEVQQAKIEASEIGNGGVDNILNLWSEILNKIKEKNYSLFMSIQMAKPISLESNILDIGFVYEIQRQRAGSHENILMLKQVLKEIFNQDFEIKTHVDLNIKLEKSNGGGSINGGAGNENQGANLEQSVQDIASAFGGEVVGDEE